MTCFVFEAKRMRAEISVPDHYGIASETVWSSSNDLFSVYVRTYMALTKIWCKKLSKFAKKLFKNAPKPLPEWSDIPQHADNILAMRTQFYLGGGQN